MTTVAATPVEKATPNIEQRRRTDPRIERSRAKLLSAATELLCDGGIDAVTVDGVAERSRVAKSTMYRHFRSRAALLAEVLRRHVPSLDTELPPGSFEEGIRTLVSGFAQAMTDPDRARILPSLFVRDTALPDVNALLARERTNLRIRVRIVLERGVSEGLLAPETDVDTTIKLLIGPLVLATLDDELDRLADLVDEVSDRYIASCRQRAKAR